MTSRDTLPPNLRTSEVADFLGCSEQFLKQCRRKGTGPEFTKLSGDLVRYPREALLAWIDANTFSRDVA